MDFEKTLESCKKILIYGENNLKTTEIFQSSLDDIISENELLILSPTLNSRLIKLSTSEIYDIIFFCDSSLYKSKMKVKSYLQKDGLRLAKIVLQKKLTRIQRRESYRLECTNVDINFSVYDEDSEIQMSKDNIIEDNDIKFDYKGIVKNISSGGVKFNTNEELEVGTIINMLIKIKDNTLITKGKILFSEELLEYEKYNFSYKLCFIDLPPTDKKFLEKYIFDEQIRIIKKSNGITK